MLATLIPLFDENVNVAAYSLFTLKDNYLLNPRSIGTGQNDGAGNISGIEIINSLGLETIADDREVFIEINHISIYCDIAQQCKAPHDKIVLLLSTRIRPTEEIVARLTELKNQGFKLAMRKLNVSDFEAYTPILKLLDYVLLNHARIDISKARIYFGKLFPNIELCAVNVSDVDDFEKLKESGGYKYYEGEFFRIPKSKTDTSLSPVKANYVELLNVVNKNDFDLTNAADVIGRDAALVVSLLKIANKLSRNSEITSIKHACAMLGQVELKRWINTVITSELCADRPNEIMRVSMLRAKFGELLAPVFGLAMNSEEIFLMGLFSLLDQMLDKPLKEALDMVVVSKDIKDSLLTENGKYSEILKFICEYETADWSGISRTLLINSVSDTSIYDSYVEALSWYHDMFVQ